MPRRAAAIAVLLFLGFAVGGLGLVSRGERLRRASERQAAWNLAAASAFSMEQQLSRSFSANYALAAIVRQHGRVDDFDALAAEMIRFYGGISTLQLAPGGVIRHIYPLAGNEAALGHDLLSDPDRRFQALEAMRTRKLTVAGPFQLKQGGVGLVARLAVFRPPESPGGEERFWGFSTVLVRLPELLRAAEIERLELAGYAYEIRHDKHVEGELAVVERSGVPIAEDPVTFPIQIGTEGWTIRVSPAGGWARGAWLVAESLVALLGAAALAGLAWVLMRQPELLRREVAARTSELAEAHARLAEDMRERERAEEQLRHAQKMEAVGQLAGGIAHDFNNVLTAILGQAQLLADESPEGSPARETAETIVGAANRASDLTRQLLGFARRGKLRTSPVDVNGVIREVTRLLGRTLDKGIRVEEVLPAEPCVVLGDSGQLQQAVLNLAVNARDAMPHGGTLRLETRELELDARACEGHPGAKPGPYVAITVADSGHGIPRELHGRIFDPFFTTKEPGRGTGMGLAMVYGIARNHGGLVQVESEEGRGARFTVLLPRSDARLTPAPVAAAGDGAKASGRILVVDDDEAPRRAAQRILQRAGYEVTAVASGEEAIRWFSDQRGGADAVLLDLAMPGMDGGACFRALRAIDPGVRVILTSGYGRDGRAQELLDEGVRAFMPKPFTPGELATAVSRAIGDAARDPDASRRTRRTDR